LRLGARANESATKYRDLILDAMFTAEELRLKFTKPEDADKSWKGQLLYF
jgi:hypothetical protein